MESSKLTRRSFVGLAGGLTGACFTGLPAINVLANGVADLEGTTNLSAEHTSVWWKNRLPRIFHPNMRSFEAVDLDVKGFVRDCAATNCEAIVMSAGGIWAFYQTKVKHHVISPTIGERDLLAEVVHEARAQGLKVIARVDFRKARPALYDLQPDWFQLDDNEQVVREGEYYATTPLGGYQNAAFAIPVMEELLNDYGVDGIHLNALGFRGIYRDKRTLQAYNGAETDFMRWREQMAAKQIMGFREAIHKCNPAALLMGELAGIHSVGWAENRGWNPRLLGRGYTNLLNTSGRIESVGESRWWPGLSAKLIAAARADGTPLINLKIEHRKYGFQDFLISPALYKLNAYQSIANGAGLKTPTYGLVGNKLDPRTSPVLAEIFGFMKAHEELLSSIHQIAPVALVVPRAMDETTNDEFIGLAHMLIERHLLFRMVYEEDLIESIPDGISALVLPAGAVDARLLVNIGEFAQQGGNVLICSSQIDTNMAGLLGIQVGAGMLEANYALAEELDWDQGPVGLVDRPRLIRSWDGADVLMVASDGLVKGDVVEDFPPLNRSRQPVAISRQRAKGRITYFAAGFGSSYRTYPHPDYSRLMDKLLAMDDAEKAVLLDGPDTVQLTAFQKEGKLIVHLVNGSGSPSVETTPSLAAMTVRVPGQQVNEAFLHTPTEETSTLTVTGGENESSVIVPQLEAYGLLELDVGVGYTPA
jgi:hypothetical protein